MFFTLHNQYPGRIAHVVLSRYDSDYDIIDESALLGWEDIMLSSSLMKVVQYPSQRFGIRRWWAGISQSTLSATTFEIVHIYISQRTAKQDSFDDLRKRVLARIIRVLDDTKEVYRGAQERPLCAASVSGGQGKGICQNGVSHQSVHLLQCEWQSIFHLYSSATAILARQ